MGLFGNKKLQKQKLQKHHEESMKSLANALQNKKVGTFRCWNCGKTQRVIYYNNDTITYGQNSLRVLPYFYARKEDANG